MTEHARSPSRVSPAFLDEALEAAASALALMGFIALKLSYDPPLGDGLDGAYYYQIARHVAAGDGFVTSVSVFHQGLEHLPQPATTYPLFPLVVGAVGRFVGIERAARVLPEAFYWLSLVLAYAWVRRAVTLGFPRLGRAAPWMALGIATLLGLNPVYHWASSRPYTESLSVSLLLATLMAFGFVREQRFRDARREALAFAGVGLLAGACYFARFQLLIVGPALALTELAGLDRSRMRRALWLVAGSALPVALWGLRIARMPGAALRDLVDHSSFRQLPELPVFDFSVPCHGFVACGLDRLAGVGVAFSPVGKDSYVAQFGWAAYALPLAALLAAFAPVRRQLGLLRHARYATLLASFVVGCMAALPLHLVHSAHWNAWGFGWRQSLPLFFALAPLLVFLLAAPVLARAGPARARVAARERRRALWLPSALTGLASLALLQAFVTLGLTSLHLGDDPLHEARVDGARVAGAYLQRRALHERTLGIEPQPIGAYTDAPLDWLACWSPPEVAPLLLEKRHVTRVVVTARGLRCPSLARIRERLVLEAELQPHGGMRVLRVAPR
jgi:hypothetical protein